VQRLVSSVQSPQHPVPHTQPPISYTPRHLAERILAEQAAMEARSSADGERKTITALVEGLDPEETRVLVATTGQKGRSATDAGRDQRLVYRGV
jgi:hypothetical protein